MPFEAVFGQLDLRFHQDEKEATFKKSLEPDLLRFGSVGGLAGCLWALLCLVVRYGVESRASGEASPIELAADDPRTWYFVVLLTVAASFGGGGACLLLRRRRGCLQVLDLEAIAMWTFLVGILLFQIGNRCVVAYLLGSRPQEVWLSGDARADESCSSIFAGGAVVYTGLFVPIRSHLLWALPAFTLGPAVVIRAAWGSPFHEAFPADLILVSLTSIAAVCCAWRNEQRSRSMWDATWYSQTSPDNQTFASRMEDVAEALCDGVIKLDGRMRVWHASQKVENFFGSPVEGMLFTELLAAEDRGVFEALARESSTELPTFSPVAKRQAMLLVVNTGQDLPRYLVGIKRERPAAPCPGYPTHQVDSVDDLSILPNLLPRDSGGHQAESACAPFLAEAGIMQKGQPKDAAAPTTTSESGTQMDSGGIADGAVADPTLGAAAPATRESGTQVGPVATVERSGNTSITWGEFGFTCRICTSRADTAAVVADPVFAESAIRHSFNWDVHRYKGVRHDDGTKKKHTVPKPSCSDPEQPYTGRFGMSAGPPTNQSETFTTSYLSEYSQQDSYDSMASSDVVARAEPCAHVESTTSGSSDQSFDGDWVLRDSVPVESSLRCLTIHGKEVIDGNGELVHLRRKSGQLLLKGGMLDLIDDVLYRYDRVDIDIAYVRSKTSGAKCRG